MEIAPDVFDRARKLKSAAVAELFASVYPAVLRVARGLTGRADVADGVVRFVMTRSAAVMPRWRDATAAERWFLHHTVLTARRAAGHEPEARSDLLAADGGGGGGAAWAAFVRAVRQLPQQQREAIVLHYGEHLNERLLGVAMDCSADAAAAHLDAGRAALRTIAVADFEALAGRLAAVYARLGPPADELAPIARRWATRATLSHRLRRVVRLAVAVVLLALIAWGLRAWKAG